MRKESESVKQLENTLFAEKIKRYPNTPIEYLVKPKLTDKTANGLTKCIILFIQTKGGQAERINTTGRCIDKTVQVTDVIGRTKTIGSIQWIKGTGTKGSADISATIKGKSVKVEVKIGKDRQSQAQKDYQQSVESAGGLYYISRDLTTFVEWYNNTFEQ